MAFPAPEQAPPPEQAGAIKLTLTQVIVDGATVFAAEDIAKFYKDKLGREISVLDLYGIRDAITSRYANAGYILSRALIPAQQIAGGVVHITVIEGYIDSVTVHGGGTDRLGLLDDYIAKIKAARPLTNAVLERSVLLMDDLPGVTVHTVLQPAKGAAQGSTLDVVLDNKAVGASLSLDNRGTRSIGPYQMDAEVELNDLFGQYDKTAIRSILTPQIDELRYIDVTHTEPLGWDGATVELEGRRSWSMPGAAIRQFDIKSQNSTLRTAFNYPLIRSRSETLRLSGGFTYTNGRTNSFGQPFSDDRVRTLSINTSYDVADTWQGSNLFQVGIDHGLDILNATNARRGGQSRAGAEPDFTKINLSAQRDQTLTEQLSVVLAAEGQYSPDILLSSEQYGLGGKLYGRAFDASEITGESGMSGKLELRYAPDLELGNVKYVQFFTYGDIGAVWNRAPGPEYGLSNLASLGVGARFGITETFSGTVEVGKPMMRTSTATGDRAPRGFFNLVARY